MKPNRLTASLGAACLLLMLGLMWSGGAGPIALALVGFGAGLMVAACALADFLCPGRSAS